MESDEEDFVFFGTPIEREEDISSRKKKAIAESSGQLRSLPAWKQEVTDEEGRRRFHGAFTGGFSAGYYNTVGSKEGWAPKTFTSSRKNRAETKQQSIYDFLDEDEKSELQGHSLGASSQFDTFGFTAVEVARKQAEKEQQNRPSAIPGPVPDEILPVSESVGVKLLMKMGWRRGRSIKDSHTDLRNAARREARKAFLAFSSEDAKAVFAGTEHDAVDHESFIEDSASEDIPSSKSTPVYALNPKQDLYGLGYDPYKNAPEFREKKRSRLSGGREHSQRNAISMKDSLFGLKSGRVAPGFGIGALEELDVEDEDIYAPGYDVVDSYAEEVDEVPKSSGGDNKQKLITYEKDGLPGFRVASNSEYQLERYEPPVIPKDFVPHHKFPGPLENVRKFADPPPPEVPAPEDNNLKILIEGVATLVARCGKLFEDLSREKNQSNPLYSFLSRGDGHGYYLRKLWEERQKRNDQSKKHLDGKISPSMQKMTAESRAKILGEKPLDRTSRNSNHSYSSRGPVHVQSTLSDTLTTQVSLSELLEAKPFKDEPAKEDRFEQFLKEKYQGGLRSTESSGANAMSEAARARERLDFEAVIEALQKGKNNSSSAQQFTEFSLPGTMQFTSGGVEHGTESQADDSLMKKMYPKREEYQWRPAPLLCKRFDLSDPYMGKPPPAPRLRSKMDSILFMPDSVKGKKIVDTTTREVVSASQSDAQDTGNDNPSEEAEAEVAVENVERPVDLYKAIFSDDSDNDEDDKETSNLSKVEDPEKKNEAANTTLSRLIASDFLESLGKELGLEVPPEAPYSSTNTKTAEPDKANTIALNGSSIRQGAQENLEVGQESETAKTELVHVKNQMGDSKCADNGLSESGREHDSKVRKDQQDKKEKNARRRRDWSGSSSSDDERSRRHSKRHRYSSDSYSDSSGDHRDRHRSRSKSKKGSTREKHNSRRHSKHHKHKRRDSPDRSPRDYEKTNREAKKEKRKRRH